MAPQKNTLTGMTYAKLGGLLACVAIINSSFVVPLVRQEARSIVDSKITAHEADVKETLEIIRTDIREIRTQLITELGTYNGQYNR